MGRSNPKKAAGLRPHPVQTNLRIPGPTPLPPRVRQALAGQMISHRGAEFRLLLRRVTGRLAAMLGTEGDVLVLTASGTGGLEAAVANAFAPGDELLVAACGLFGRRWAEIARAYGLAAHLLEAPWGEPVSPQALGQALDRHPQARAVLLTHNETSTGVLNDLPALARVARQAGKLLLVDAISSAGCVELEMDAWGVDLLVTGSQKGWMIPPGLSMVAAGPRFWEAHHRARLPRYYFDLGLARRAQASGETPFTPAVNLLVALDAALDLLEEEGLQAVVRRHLALRDQVRGEARRLGLPLLASDGWASPTVTAILAPSGLSAEVLRTRLHERHGVVVAGGQGPLKGRLLRVGHLGWVHPPDVQEVMAALEEVLGELGHGPPHPGP